MQRAQPGDREAFPTNQQQQMSENYLRAQGLLPAQPAGGHFEFGDLSVGFSNIVGVFPDDFPNYDENRLFPFEGVGPIYK